MSKHVDKIESVNILMKGVNPFVRINFNNGEGVDYYIGKDIDDPLTERRKALLRLIDNNLKELERTIGYMRMQYEDFLKEVIK